MKFGISGSSRGVWHKLQAALGNVQIGNLPIGKPPIIATPPVTRLREISDFGTNPGNLRMFTYVPGSVDSCVSDSPALVVVLHGCGQTAAGYDHGAGWSSLADRYGFALLMPQQQPSNNQNTCFNWFLPEDTQRGRGEAASIKQMIDTMTRETGVDPSRVFITGLSAGGAMTSVMLACYPDVFAAGAIVAGLPFGSASNLQQALQSMYQSPPRVPREWGDAVRAAGPRVDVKWPRVSVWHGATDKTVIPSNAREILKQWTDVHGLPQSPTKQMTVDGHPRQVWLNDRGEEAIEFYNIAGMGHGTPLATGGAGTECGHAGPFLLDVGISSTFHIATFFGLTTKEAISRTVIDIQETVEETIAGAPLGVGPVVAPENMPPQVTAPQFMAPRIIEQEIEDREGPAQFRMPNRIDIGAVITKALTAAGLMK
jgi:poly(hydroxyalkanoate) depolymerase family esterase